MRDLLILSALLGASVPGWSEISMSTHSNPKNGPIWKVCVLRADTTLMRVGMKGGASMQAESQQWADRLTVTVKEAVAKAGGTPSDALPAGPDHSADQARQAFVQIRGKYENIARQLLKKPGGVEKGRYTLGDEVALLPCAREAEVLAFVDGRGILQTNGRKTFDVLVGGVGGMLMARSRYDIWVSLADAKSGQVIGFVHESGVQGNTQGEQDDSLREAFAGEFRKVHIGWVRPPGTK